VRQEALALDGHRCQVCGVSADTAVIEVHHVKALGMGGSDERDTVENCITLCGKCHQDVENGKRWIQEWDRVGGVFVYCDQLHKPVASALWFHRRKLAEELAPIEARIQGLHMIDGEVASDLWRLWRDDAYKALDPEAPSFVGYAAARGWDARRAASMARLYDRGKELEIDWPERMTAPDFRRQLKNAGHIEARRFLALAFRDGATVERLLACGDVQWLRATDDELAELGQPVVRIGKAFGLPKETSDGTV